MGARARAGSPSLPRSASFLPANRTYFFGGRRSLLPASWLGEATLLALRGSGGPDPQTTRPAVPSGWNGGQGLQGPVQNTSVGCQETKAGGISEPVTAEHSANGGAVPGVGAPAPFRPTGGKPGSPVSLMGPAPPAERKVRPRGAAAARGSRVRGSHGTTGVGDRAGRV